MPQRCFLVITTQHFGHCHHLFSMITQHFGDYQRRYHVESTVATVSRISQYTIVIVTKMIFCCISLKGHTMFLRRCCDVAGMSRWRISSQQLIWRQRRILRHLRARHAFFVDTQACCCHYYIGGCCADYHCTYQQSYTVLTNMPRRVRTVGQSALLNSNQPIMRTPRRVFCFHIPVQFWPIHTDGIEFTECRNSYFHHYVSSLTTGCRMNYH